MEFSEICYSQNYREPTLQNTILSRATASQHTDRKKETQDKSSTDRLSKVRLNPYILARDPTDTVPS